MRTLIVILRLRVHHLQLACTSSYRSLRHHTLRRNWKILDPKLTRCRGFRRGIQKSVRWRRHACNRVLTEVGDLVSHIGYFASRALLKELEISDNGATYRRITLELDGIERGVALCPRSTSCIIW